MALAMLGEPHCVELPPERAGATVTPHPPAPSVWDAQFAAAETWSEYVWATARECLDDIAVLRTHRTPARHESYRSASDSEERLLAQIDAVLVGGRPVLARIPAWTLDAAVPDADRMFAGVLVLGCVEGAAGPIAAVDLLRASAERDESGEGEELAGGVEALCLAPHHGVAEAVRRLLGDDLPLLRAAALTVLGYRNELTPAEGAAALADQSPLVLAAAATAAGRVRAPALAPALAALTGHPHEEVVRAVLYGCLAAGADQGLSAARRLCLDGRPEFADAVIWVALAGMKGDQQILERALTDQPGGAAAAAAGLFGQTALVPMLLQLLKDGEETAQPAVAAALVRLLGSGPQDTVAVPSHDPEDEPFLDRVPEPEVRSVPSLDPARWAAWWQQHRGEFTPATRYRDGRPLGPGSLLNELESGPGDPESRRRAYAEFTWYAGERFEPRLEPLDFLPRQERALAAVRTWVHGRGTAGSDGRWLG